MNKNKELIFIAALMSGNFLNFIFNAYLGRALTFEQFGLVTLLTTFAYLLGIFVNALSSAVNHKVSFLSGKYDHAHGVSFYLRIQPVIFKAGLAATLAFILIIPLLSGFFHTSDSLPFILFIPCIALGFLLSSTKGYLSGKFLFQNVGILIIIEAISKLITAFILVNAGFTSLAYISIPFSIFAAFLFSYLIFSEKTEKIKTTNSYGFPKRFFLAALIAGFATNAFLTFDIILAKHFLSPILAGEYALLSLVGKMVYFFGSLLSVFIVTFAGRDEGRGISPNRTFYKLFAGTFLLVIVAFIFLGPLGSITLPYLFGIKAIDILPYVFTYTLAVSLFTLTSSLYTYHLARRHYVFSFVSLIISSIMSAGIILYHRDIFQITHVVLIVAAISFFAILLLHFLQRDGQFILRNLVDFVNVFFPLPRISLAFGKKRILIFNWRDTKHKYAGGAEVYIQELAKRWVGKGHSVTLFCGNDSKCCRNEVIDGVQVIRRGGFYFVYLWAFLYYLLKFRGRYDVIIDCENGIPFFAPLYAREPIYCVIHHVHQEVFTKYLPKPLSLIASFLESRVMPWAYRNAKFITVSESTKKDMNDLNIKGIATEIIPNGVDLEKLKLGEKDKSPLVLYLGRLKSYKSVNVLIASFKKVIEIIPEVRLIIAGDGEERAGLERMAIRLKLSDKITFLGRVSEEEKVKLFQRAWVCVNPSFFEGWGITSIEANACGTPVIASNVSGLRDSVRNPHTGFLVPYGDVELFADRIVLLLKDKKLRGQMSEGAIKWAIKFDWEKSIKKFNSILNSLN